MYLAAVARPIPEHNFDGQIGLYPVAEWDRAKYNSSRRTRGTPVLKPINMDAALFKEMIKNKVVADALRKCGWATNITIQMDNAGGHGGGRGNIADSTLKELSQWASALPEEFRNLLPNRDAPPKIVFIAQPPRSPDLNVLDLGAWHSMDAAIDHLRRAKMARELIVEELHNTASEAWSQWQGAEKLGSLFSTLRLIWEAIVRDNGGNSFEIPHRT